MGRHNYTITNQLYVGARYVTYQATREPDDTPFVLKLLKDSYPSVQALNQLRHEFALLQWFSVDTIVRPIALEPFNTSLGMVSEAAPGITLADYAPHKPVALPVFFAIACSLVSTVEILHRQRVIHRNMSPTNVLFDADSGRVTLCGFSLATELARESQYHTAREAAEADLAYVSPEQTGRINRAVDHRTDMYSLGCLFYQLLTGHPPFEAKDPMELVHAHLALPPRPPQTLRPDLPPVLSQLVLRLLAKRPEDRYQSATGLLHDLERCRQGLTTSGAVPDFVLGEHDISDQFQLPDKLYGRAAEIEQLVSAFRQAETGPADAVLIGGYSGVGKSALVRELQKVVGQTNGLFISGKFDQFKGDMPLSSLLAAFRQLIRQLLAEPDAKITRWRQRVLQAVGQSGQVLVDVLPDLTLLIGPQPAVPELPPVEATNRFNQVFDRFIDVFLEAERPLCLFLDDLQWIDSATRQWVEARLSGQQAGHFLFVGAYRDNEVTASHPLLLMVDRLVQSGTRMQQLSLQPIDRQNIKQLIVDTLTQTPERCADLAEAIFQKTGGNPFFTRQCLLSLYEEGAIYFNPDQRSWAYDIEAVRQTQLSDNVVDLMGKLIQRLPAPVQNLLKTAACIGNQFDSATLNLVVGQQQDDTTDQLNMALQQGLIMPVKAWQVTAADEFTFLHDRVQQAALAMLDVPEKQAIRLKTGRLLLANPVGGAAESNIYDIADHLNAARHLIIDPQEQQQVVAVNLKASIRAKNASAYEPALRYCQLAMELVPASAWAQPSVLTRELLLQRAESEHLCGNNEAAEGYFDQALVQASATLDKARIYQRKIHYYTNLSKFELAYQTGRKAVGLLGVHLPVSFFPPALVRDLLTNRILLGRRKIADIISLKEMTDERLKMAVQLMASFARSAYQIKPELCVAVCARIVNLCLRHGNTAGGSTGFLAYGPIFMGAILGQKQTGFDFGQLTLAMAEKFNDYAYKAETHFVVGYFAMPWRRPASEMEQHWQIAYETGLESGDFFHASCACCGTIQSLYMRGINFDDILATADRYGEFLHRINNTEALLTIQAVQQSIRNLRGETNDHQSYSDATVDEAGYVAQLAQFGARHFAHYYFINKMQTLYLWGNYEHAYTLSIQSDQYLNDSPGMLHTAEHYFYKGLIMCALYPNQTGVQRLKWKRTLASINARFRKYAAGAPANFGHKAQLLAAEICRINQNRAGAEKLYDAAIESARQYGYIQIQALASELLGRFHSQAGHRREAGFHLRNAEYAFRQWGATAYANELHQRYPALFDLLDERTYALAPSSNGVVKGLMKTGASSLDMSTILKSSEAISREIRLPDLLSTLMKIIIENAGGQRMVFLLQRGPELVVQAEYLADSGADSGQVTLLDEVPLTEYANLARSVVNYVARTQEPVILDVATQGDYANDAYIQAQAPRSVLCAPLVQLGKLIGVIYLENNLTDAAFTQDRINLLILLSGQMAISIENALLYKNLEEKVVERTAALNQSLDHLKTTQNQLIQQEKMASLGEMTAGIAHEIQNPLNFVNNFAEVSADMIAELLEEQQKPSRDLDGEADLLSDITRNLKFITEHGRRASGIVKGMLEHSRTSTGERQLTDLNTLTDEFLRLTYQGLLSKDNTFSCELITRFSATMGKVLVVQQDLGRVLLNLFNNAFYAVTQQARQAAPGGDYKPTVWVSTERMTDHVEIRIRDNGTGMTEAVKTKIFQPFFTNKPTGQGIGLGLSLSYDIVTKGHGGQLTVNTAPGEFSEFIITLPIVVSD